MWIDPLSKCALVVISLFANFVTMLNPMSFFSREIW
jgi:hypothetical protein